MKFGKAYIGDVLIGDPGVDKVVRFYDYDGTLLYHYTLDEIRTLPALPEGPSHEGLVFKGWNWTLEEVRALTHFADIGAIYDTTDDETRFHITVEVPSLDYVNLYLEAAPGEVRVDFGDGSVYTYQASQQEIITIPRHTYAAAGDYVIRVTGIAGVGTSNGSYPCFVDQLNRVLRKVELSREIGNLYQIAFKDCKRLESIAISQYKYARQNFSVAMQPGFLQNCQSLKALVLPRYYYIMYGTPTLLGNSYALEVLSFHGAQDSSRCELASGFAVSSRLTRLNLTWSSLAYLGNLASLQEIAFEKTPEPIYRFFDLRNCKALKRIVFPENISNTGYIGRCNGCVALEEVVFGAPVELPSTIFSNCESLRSLKNFVIAGTSIGANAFQNTFIEEITIPATITTIGSNAFSNCRNLQRVTLNEGLQGIDPRAFDGCYSLKEITIPSTVLYIGDYAFAHGGANLETVHIKATTPPAPGTDMFASSLASNAVIYVPKGTLNNYLSYANWEAYSSYMQEEP